MDYIVAFVYTRETGGYEGVVTWSAFKNEQHFNELYTPDIKARKRVVEKGITKERAIELAQQTPQACRIAAALHEAGLVD